ncbi:GNAT family N-acetyltransferase [Nocardioides pacificus]
MRLDERAGLAVRRAGEADWEQVRALRLAALADAPTAFESTFEHESQYDETDWRAWCQGTATFLALWEGVPIGLSAGMSGNSPDERLLVAVWLDPAHRGTGASAELLAAVRVWALDDGASRLTLWVTRINRPAAQLYRRSGFAESGASKPLPSNPALIEDQLVLDLR